MKSILAGLIIAAGLAAQVSGEAEIRDSLASTLAALRGGRDAAQSDILTGQLQIAFEAGHAASRATIAQFSRELTSSLSGRTLPRATAVQIAAEIVTVMRSAGVATYKYKEAITRFEMAISGAGITSAAVQNLTRSLTAVGSEVRGPDDMRIVASRK